MASSKLKRAGVEEKVRNAKAAPEILAYLTEGIADDKEEGGGGDPGAPSVEAFSDMLADTAAADDAAARYAEAFVAYLVRTRGDGPMAVGDGVFTLPLSLCGRSLPFLVESLLILGRRAAFAKVAGGMLGDDDEWATWPDRRSDDVEGVGVAPWEVAGALGAAWQALVSPESIIEAVHHVWKVAGQEGQEGGWPENDAPVWAWLHEVIHATGEWLIKTEAGSGLTGEGSLCSADLQAALAKLRDNGAPAKLRHPLAPLVRQWLRETAARPGEWDTRPTAIIPAPFAIVRDLRSAQGELFADISAGLSEQRQRKLPGFESDADERLPFGRVVPLMMFDATGTLYETRGQGAPLALRLWIEAVTAPDRLERDRPVKLETSLRDLVKRLWPNGWTGPGRDGEKLLAALRAIDGARIPWPGSDEGWRAVSVVNPPAIRDPASPVVLTVLLPPGSDRGPLVYRNVLREYGVTSAPLYRLGLAVAYLWDRYFTHKGPLPVLVPDVKRDRAGNLLDAKGNVVEGRRNGKPAHWNHPRAVRTGTERRNPALSRIPDLRADDLLFAAYSRADVDAMTPGMRRQALSYVRAAALDMKARGHAVVVESGARGAADWRIRIEPPDWHGAPEIPGGDPATANDYPATANDYPATANDYPATANAKPATANAGIVDHRKT